MRSRDGNRTCTLSIFKLIFFFYSLALSASEYLISYRYVVKDTILYNEKLDISQSMHKCTGNPNTPLILENDGTNNLKKIISQNEEEFSSYLHQLGIEVKHSGFTSNQQNRSTTILTLKTTCFKVDFNDTFVKIAPLK
jgi:hypothetical protein